MGAVPPDNVSPSDALPQEVLARMDGQLDGRTVLAWSKLDLDDANRYARRHVVLTDNDLITVADGTPHSLSISRIQEANIVEGLGVDRLRVLSDGKVAAELRYTHRHRRGMTRLHRKLARRLPRKEGEEAPPEWLDTVERQAEEKERCPKCGELIPAYAE